MSPRSSEKLPPLPPYSDIAFKLLKSIMDALLILCGHDDAAKDAKNASDVKSNEELDIKLRECFEWVHKEYPRYGQLNKHLTLGLKPLKHKTKKDNPCRLAELTKLAFIEAQKAEDQKAENAAFIPSPLQILYNALTVPDELQSRAYALITCRTILFECFSVHPKGDFAPVGDGWRYFEERDLFSAYSTIRTYTDHRDNVTAPKGDGTMLFLAHFLAMKGVLTLRFGTEKKEPLKGYASLLRREYCKSHDFSGQGVREEFRQSPDFKKTQDVMPEYRLSPNFNEVPDLAEIVNQIYGIPIPIVNADVIFYGGLKPSANGGLVVSISGEAGTGKTSSALALAATLAPLGTVTYYLTFEEHTRDLGIRLETLIPNYLRKLSIFPKDIEKWFFPYRTELPYSNEQMKLFIENHLEVIKNKIKRTQSPAIPAPCPLLVVIDGISMLAENGSSDTPYKMLHDFIKACKGLNVLVVLLSGKDNKILKSLDYIVDMLISLEYSGTERPDQKPLRILRLQKSRLQDTRSGAHVFHLSSERGFRLSPQVPSQLGRQQHLAQHLYDETRCINIFAPSIESDLTLLSGSRILIHGHGSSGKAGLALRILLTLPTPINNTVINNTVKTDAVTLLNHPRRRVLVLSFLYPKSYYKKLERKLTRPVSKKVAAEFPSLPRPKIEYLSFYPGFLSSEDFLNKIIRAIKGAELQGEPYTGVLLDGLHNVFLQFPSLEKTMAWPMIYNVLIRSKVTTVTTFTTFSFPSQDGARGEGKEHEMFLEGHKPFLHTLVRAVDFYLQLEREAIEETDEETESRYVLTVKEAIGQPLPRKKYLWDREKCYARNYTKR